MKHIIIVDKQDITRVGLESLIRNQPSVQTFKSANNKAELVKHLLFHPDSIVIIDYSLSDFTSIDALLNVSSRFEQARWLLFSDELSNDFLQRLFMVSKAYSIVLKSSTLTEINMALTHVFCGEQFICEHAMSQLQQAEKDKLEKPDSTLTNTEREILKEIALGHTTKEIASNRNLSFHTITTHRKNIFRKIEVNNVHEATKYAIRTGIVDMTEYYI